MNTKKKAESLYEYESKNLDDIEVEKKDLGPLSENILSLKKVAPAANRPEQSAEKTNSHFYQVKNHHELFKVGTSFYKDFQQGLKSFGIGSTGYESSQQKTILGLASFFDHSAPYKIGIVSDNLQNGFFSEIVKSSSAEVIFLENGMECEIFTFHNHFDFIHYDHLFTLFARGEAKEVMNSFLSYYDVIFWDLVSLDKIQQTPEKHIPIISSFDSLTLVVSRAQSNKDDIDSIKKFFSNYDIQLKGLIFDSSTSEEKVGKEGFLKKFLRKFI